jgi:hypothetical protein
VNKIASKAATLLKMSTNYPTSGISLINRCVKDDQIKLEQIIRNQSKSKMTLITENDPEL